MNLFACALRCLPHAIAVLVIAVFCLANTFQAHASAAVAPANELFIAMLQGQMISIPLLLLPVGVSLIIPGWRQRLGGWFARPSCTFGAAMGAFLLLCAFSYMVLAAMDPAEDQLTVAMFKQLNGLQSAVIAFFICLLVPFVEELLFRGVLMQSLPVAIGLPFSALLFALAHGVNVYLFPLFLTGWMLGMLRLRTGSLLVSICAHAAFNTVSLLLTLLAS